MAAHRLAAAVTASILLVSACTGSDPSPGTGDPATTRSVGATPSTVPLLTLPPGAAVCDGYGDVVEAGRLTDDALSEVSGLAASRRHPGVIWVHNDSRGGPVVYAVAESGELLATWEIDGAIALDWEDMAIGPGPEPGVSYIYAGDIGDNFGLRGALTIYRFPEPGVDGDGRITEYERLRVAYPRPGHDAEALAVDPVTGDLIVITKDRSGPEIVYLAAASDLVDGETTTMQEIARPELGDLAQVTGADFSPGGERLAFRGYRRVWMWPRTSADLGEVLGADPCRAASPDEVQGEALGFSVDGVSLFTISEGTGAAVNRVGSP